jgi:protein-tyrosine phosphatase
VIDLHAHVLPGLDDGPADEAGAVALAAEAARAGVRTLAATPHLRADFPGVDPLELPGRVAALRERLDVPLELVSGGEVDVLWAQQATDEALRAVSFGARGSDLLVETPYGELPAIFEDLLFQIRLRGFRVLLAHPERNPSFQAAPGRLAALAEQGTLIQVTAASLAAGGRAGRLAQRLIADGHAHVIASDTHRAGGRRASLREGVAAAHATARAEWMVTAAPAAILAGEPLPPAPEAPPRRRLWRH